MRRKERGAVRSPRAPQGGASGGRRRAARSARAVFAAALALMALLSAAAPVRAQSRLVVVSVLNGALQVYEWDGSEIHSRVLAQEGVVRPSIAPSGDAVAYTHSVGDFRQTSLWLADLTEDPLPPRLLVDAPALPPADPARQIGQFIWSAAGDALYFNTTLGLGIETRPQNDLWRVDVRTAHVTPLLASGEGGNMSPAPNSVWLALIAPGRYGDIPAQVAFYNTQTAEHVSALRYEAVSSGSELPWYPSVRWLPDGSGVRLAVPPPDWLYGKGEGVVLWELRPGDEARQLGMVEADFFGLPRFSPDGERILYVQRRTAPQQNTWTLTVAAADGSDAAEYIRGPLLFGSLRWLPQGERFFYALSDAPRTLWLGQVGYPPLRFPASDVHISALMWADAETFVYLSESDGRYTLAFATLGAPDETTPIATLENRPLFDALRP